MDEAENKLREELKARGISEHRAEEMVKGLARAVENTKKGKQRVVDVSIEEIEQIARIIENTNSMDAKALVLEHNAYEVGVGEAMLQVIEKLINEEFFNLTDKRLATIFIQMIIGRIITRIGEE